jgi:putative nucleic acid binding protein
MLTLLRPTNLGPVLLVLLLSIAGQSATGQDNVSVPKSRLEELERKEKELEKLKGDLDKTKGDLDKTKEQNLQLKKENEKAAMRPVEAPPAQPVVTFVSPPLESLPAVQPYDTVESMDLANYYHADTSAADHRFRKRKLTVRGEIVGFEKPLYKRNYRILLKTPTRETKVICDFLPPDKANAVFTTNHGDDLVALMGETRVPIAKVGQTAIVKGECKGSSESAVMILGWDLKVAR